MTDILNPALVGGELLALAERCEAATGPNRHLDYAIFCATAVMDGRNQWHPLDGNEFTASLDAAMTLVAGMDQADAIREAVSNLGKAFNLHICFWPSDKSYPQHLARFIIAAALRSRISTLTQGVEGV